MQGQQIHSDDQVYATYLIHKTENATAKALGLQRGTHFRRRLKKIISKRCATPAFTPADVPETIRKPAELIQQAILHRERLQANLKAKHESVLPIHNNGKPFAVALLPDQHMDNPGSNLKLIFRHAEIIAKTDGLYAVELGDAIDNFIIGKLEAARREHIVTVREAWALTEHYHRILAPKLLAAISGNHLEWTHRLGGVDYLQAILYQAKVKAIYDADEVYFYLKASNGQQWKYGLRHFFIGSSMWNAAHSVVRYAMSHAYQGEHVVAAGHKHVAGYQIVQSHGQTVHCVQTGSYKDRDLDDHCRTKGYMAQHPFLAPTMVHFPDTGKTHFIPEIEEAIPYLKFLRKKK